MPQMVTTAPAAPQASPKAKVSSPGNKEKNEFSPHLKNAISEKKQQQQAVQDKSRKDTPSSPEKSTLIDENSQALESKQSKNNPDPSMATGENPADVQDKTSEQTLLNTEKPTTLATDSVLAPSQEVNIAANPSLNASTKTGNESNTVSPFPTPDTIQPNLTPAAIQPNLTPVAIQHDLTPVAVQPEKNPSTTEPEIQNTIKPAAAKGQDALLSQLQNIIDKANETGIVSITKVPNTTLANSINSNIHGAMTFSSENTEPINVTTAAHTAGSHLNGLFVADADGIEKTAGKSAQHMNGIRQDSPHQYFGTKITMQNLANNTQNFQENPQGDKLPPQSSGSNLQSGLFSAPEQTNTFSQVSSIVQETTTQPITESAKPIVLPSGVLVHEDEIIQQLSQKFQISGRNMDSRINLKLHPAELGALKIDLTVKEGSIRANIVAQSQHTLEILDKNLAKLKTVLENQGFTVDEITITAESESVSDFDLFDRQLFSRNDYTPKTAKNRQDNEAVFTLADNVFAPPVLNTGVNVKV